jgi:hypothetical protein
MQPNCSFRLNLYIALYFCFVGISNAQTPQAGLTSSPSDTSGVLAICQGMQVTFTAFQSGLATAPKSFEFLLVRTGTATITARTRSDSNIWVATAGTDFLHGDQILVRAYDRTTSQGGGTPYDSRRILLQITNPPPVTLTSDAPGNTFCNNETVNFSVSPQIVGAQYSFYVDGKLQQGPNALSQFSTQNLADNDIVSVEVNNSGCISQASVQVFLNNITDSGSIGFVTATNPVAPQQICYGSSPLWKFTLFRIQGRTQARNGTAGIRTQRLERPK